MLWILTLYFFQLFGVAGFSYAEEETYNKRLFAYVGGANEIVKIDMETYKITKSLRIPGGGHHIHSIQISPNAKEIYITGDWFWFDDPMIVIDSKSLEITKELSREGLEDAKSGLGFSCRGRLSPDGKRFAINCGYTYFALIDTETLKVIDRPYRFNSNPMYESIFSDDSKLLYILTNMQYDQQKPSYESRFIILDAVQGRIIQQILLPKFSQIGCETNISEYTGEKSNIFITCNHIFNMKSRGLLKEDIVYPFIPKENANEIKLIKVKTRRVINKIRVPGGRGDINAITLTPDGKKLLIGRGGYRDPGELTIIDVQTKKIITRIMLDGGATSNVVFGYE